MRTVPAAITTARQSASSRLCKIWRIERTDGTVLRFTEHDRDLTVDGETFLATASFDPSSIKVNADLSVSDMDVQGAFDSSYITAEDLLAGRYNGASFWVAECLWDNVAAGKDIQKFGWLGNVKEAGGQFVAELLGPERILNRNILRLYTVACAWTLGDSRCGVTLAGYTQAGTVSSVTSRRVFGVTGISVPGGEEADWFTFGKVTFTSGANDGLSMEVKNFDGTEVELMLPMPFDVAPSDTFDIVTGCNKSLGACRYRFNNVLNFGGFPHAPQSDDVIKGIVNTETAPTNNAILDPSPTDGSASA
jgi:uncharacterized phage protein (TIGR02218 family)